MPTTFNVFSLGTLALIDPIEGNSDSENAAALVGMTFGGPGTPLHGDIQEFSAISFAGGVFNVYDQDNTLSNDTFSIDGGPAQTYDASTIYNATVTFADGTTVSVTAVVFQDISGNTYLASEILANSDNSAYESLPIRSVTLDSIFDDGFTVGNIAIDGLVADRQPNDGLLTCFVKGTSIRTSRGEVAIEDISVGDLIATADHGLQKFRWIGSRKCEAFGNYAPIVFSKGAIGNTRELRVSPLHRMLLAQWRAEILFGEAEVLVPAKFLLNDQTIKRVEGGTVEYFHMLFDTHQIVFGEGVPSESFYPGEHALGSLGTAQSEEIFEIFPELQYEPLFQPQTARMVINRHETVALLGTIPIASSTVI